jgi:hypothetical protein
MEALELVVNFEKYLTEIEQVVKPEYAPILKRLKETDPHDFFSPDAWFQSESAARGFVWTMFLKEVKKSKN